MKTTRNFFLLVLFFLGFQASFAQETPSPFRIGFHLRQLGGDFGMGAHADVPTGAKWPILRFAGTWQWMEIPGVQTGFETASYATLRLGAASKSFQIQDRIRAYGEGGLLSVFPSNELSGKDFQLGGYGLFGFEFFASQYGGSALFIELGASSAGNDLDAEPGVPSFGAGFWVGAGLRLAL
ncbi:hypothetical protein [Robiginitalea marina]|uniref:Outer membrane protein beta-barrel domain-containing protein n=1 Tax=Robiginitalea marina TaxID=2954105 RepID=A0ABT1AX35_9FLAO|nr:hypothetical protein [Robiginitalea marina]MCO5723908.1 hypothetical protein [Robiginitalea marina]